MGQSVHVVARGETLAEIARANGTDVATILQDNPRLTKADDGDRRPRDKDGNLLYPGDEVVIKKNEFRCERLQEPGSPYFRCRYNNREGVDKITVEPFEGTVVGPDGKTGTVSGIKIDLSKLFSK